MRRAGLLAGALLLSACSALVLHERVEPEPLTADHTQRDYVPALSRSISSGPSAKALSACKEPVGDAGALPEAWEAQARCLEGQGRYGAAERARAEAERRRMPARTALPTKD